MKTSDRKRLGQQLRSVRMANHLSLKQVEKLSKGRFKASIVGSYERGERAVSTYRLVELASLYGVSPAWIVSEASRQSGRRRFDADAGIRIDLQRVAEIGVQGYRDLKTYVDAIRTARHDPSSTVLTIREQDLGSLATAMGTPARSTIDRMTELQLLAQIQRIH